MVEVKDKDVEGDDIEVIEVKGICFSQCSVLDCKKMVGIIIDFLVVEDIGMFLDKNVGEVL